jgi:hypothetical protein
MTTVETRVVNPVKSVPGTESDLVGVSMKEEEEEMLVDEEISSSEGLELENQMLTVALVKSVVDATPCSDKKESPSSRYGLRKRRRPGDSSAAEASPSHVPGQVAVDRLQTPHVPPLLNPEPSNTMPAPSSVATTVKAKQEQIKLLPPPLQPQGIPIPSTYTMHKSSVPKEPISLNQPLTIKEGVLHGSRGTKIKDHPILGKLQGNVALTPGNMARPTLTNQVKPIPPVATKKPAAPRRKLKRPPKTKGASPKHELVPTSGAVPNPLSQATPSPAGIPRPYVPRHPGSRAPLARPPATAVPCPLPTSVPCPLQPDSMGPPLVEKKKHVTISEPPVQSRPRVFSVDLDGKFFFVLIVYQFGLHNKTKYIISCSINFRLFGHSW